MPRLTALIVRFNAAQLQLCQIKMGGVTASSMTLANTCGAIHCVHWRPTYLRATRAAFIGALLICGLRGLPSGWSLFVTLCLASWVISIIKYDDKRPNLRYDPCSIPKSADVNQGFPKYPSYNKSCSSSLPGFFGIRNHHGEVSGDLFSSSGLST
jgi:hypothetical protein